MLPSKILNLYNLEIGISFLKKAKILHNCSYNIISISKGLIVTIEYSLYINNIKYTCKQENRYTLQKNFVKILRYIKYYINNFHFQYLINVFDKHLILKFHRFSTFIFIYNWNLINNLQVELYNTNHVDQINVKLSLINIINNYIESYLFYNYRIIYNYFFFTHYHYIQILNSNFIIEKISKLQIKTQQFTIKFKYNLTQNINIIQKLILQCEEKYFICIYKYSYNQDDNLKLKIYKNLFNIYKLIQNQPLHLIFLLTYPKLQYFTIFKYCNIYIHFLFYSNTKIQKGNIINNISRLYPNIEFNYNYKLYIPSFIPYTYQNTIKLKSRINICDMTKNLIDKILFNDKKYQYSNIKYKSIKFVSRQNYILKTKYTLYPIKYIALYYFAIYKKSYSYQIVNIPQISNSQFMYQHDMQIGIGLNIYIPFTNKPMVFIEYFTNDQYKKNFYIGTKFN
uniref:Uncharacterized protein n=1 Tax=Gracilaria edulis TaxID=172966 RepID=A0A6C0A9I4_9FLOR|nr:hypothetical protein [Gracilaria edulis]QHS70468.1 hypothetical protein [Gracilaria edulis]